MINYSERPKRELGQNFLNDQEAVVDLINASDPQAKDIYLEIGAGQGVVTKALAPRAKRVVAVEFDRDLIPQLKENLRSFSNVEIINDDILHFLTNPSSLITHHFSKIVGSIPYQIASPLLHQLTELIGKTEIKLTVLLIQKEVAEKIIAQPPKASYLSNFVQTYFDTKIIRNVSRESFRPVPKVNGAIVKLVARSEKLRIEPGHWSEFLHFGFKHPRQMLKKVFDEKILLEADIRPSQRAQELKLQQWLRIYRLAK